MSILPLFLMVLALVLFFLAALGVSALRFNLVAGGLFCWILAEIVSRFPLR